MKYFFLINKIFPNISLKAKFGINDLLNLFEDEQLHYRILKAFCIIDIDLNGENSLDSTGIISDLIWSIKYVLKLKEVGRFEIENNFFALTIFLDVFFLLNFPQNLQLIEILKLNSQELDFKNFEILKKLINELYVNSRENNLKLKTSFFHENSLNENKTVFPLKSINASTQISELFDFNCENSIYKSNDDNQLFEYKPFLKIGIPSPLDFNFELNHNRINFFYSEDENYTIVLKCVIFSLNLRDGILENLLRSLSSFQNIYQYNTMSILILRLIICRYADTNQILPSLEQLISIGNSPDTLNSLFECSLLLGDNDLSSIFDFYHHLIISSDFHDIVVLVKNLTYLTLEKNHSSLKKFSPWIKIQLDYLDSYKKFLKKGFLNKISTINYYLECFKSEINSTSKKFDNLVFFIKNLNYVQNKNLDLILNYVNNLIYSVSFVQRNEIIEIINMLFSLSLYDEYKKGNSDFVKLIVVNHMVNDFFIENFSLNASNKNSSSPIFVKFYSELIYGEFDDLVLSTSSNNFEEIFESILIELWKRFLTLLIETKENKMFLQQLKQILQIISKKQRIPFFWFLISHNNLEISSKISELYLEKRRIGSLQCAIYCIELELNDLLEKIKKLSKYDFNYELSSTLLFIIKHLSNTNLREKFLCFLDASDKKKMSILECTKKILNNFKRKFQLNLKIEDYNRFLREIDIFLSRELALV